MAAGEGSQGPRTFAQVLKENKFTEIQEVKLAKKREEEALAKQRSDEKFAKDEEARMKREGDKRQREEEKKVKEEQDRRAHNKAVAERKGRLVELTALDKQVKEKMAQQTSFKLDNWEQELLDNSKQEENSWAAEMNKEDPFAKPLLRRQRDRSSPGQLSFDKKFHSSTDQSPSPHSSRGNSPSSRGRDSNMNSFPPVVRDPLHNFQ